MFLAWKRSKPTVRSYSSAEAEYIAASDTLANVTPLEFIEGKPIVPQLFLDSESAIKIATGDDMRPRSRHYALRYYRVRDASKQIRFTTTELMRAELVTKPNVSAEQRQLLFRVAKSEFNRRRPTASTSAWGGMSVAALCMLLHEDGVRAWSVSPEV